MIVAVTGATGHIGANLVRSLLARKHRVRALVFEHTRGIDGLDVEVVKGDIRDPATLERAFSGAEVVYHLAAIISLSMNDWPVLESTNVQGTHNVVEACLKCGVRRLVHFRSIHAVSQEPMNTPVDELRPLVDSFDCPPYDRSKAAGEREVRQGIEQGLDSVILNPTGVIGPHDYQLSFFGEVLLLMAQGKLPALVEGGFDWVDARDVAEAAIHAEEMAPTGAKYLLSGKWASVRELAKMVEEIAGTPAPRLVVPTWMARTGAPIMTAFSQMTGKRPLYTSASIRALYTCNSNISHDRATSELGYHPRPIKETLADTLLWFQTAGMFTTSAKIKTTEKL
jgi:dihydroflavonol-4-reductase